MHMPLKAVGIGRLVAVLALLALGVAGPAAAQAPLNGTPISAGLGPTYGDPWCAPTTGESVNSLQGSPLALIPYAAIECSLAKFRAEAEAAGVPERMTYSVMGHSSTGRPLYLAVVNALETPEQRRDFARWQQLRAIELEDPARAQALLEEWDGEVKMPIFIEANIHGDEREGADAMMQALRDLTTTPRGAHPLVDKILDKSVLIVIPVQNPDGRVAGTRANANGFDMNRDYLVQSQSETRANIKVQQEWLATNGLALHGYVNPTLVDGQTKPHNPGLEYDIFLKWNQRRLDANGTAFGQINGAAGSNGYRIQRPVNQWNQAGSLSATGNPAVAEGWDDWGPFYTQTYISLLGIDSSTIEMCNSTGLTAGCGGQGRLGSKKTQYVGFYSSVDYWLDNSRQMMHDQLEIFRRGVTDAPRPNCCDDPLIASRNFTESQHNWMVEYPKAYVIPQNGGGQRSNAEAKRLVQWLLDNGIKVTRADSEFTWGETTYPAGSYVVWMNQALRGLALTSLSAGQDISTRITQLYAPPGAWSHGLLWGADVVEIPRGDATFDPATTVIEGPNELVGGVRGGASVPADWYSVTLRGVSEVRTVYGLLRAGVKGEVAEEAFATTTGGSMAAGSLVFANDPATVAALDAAGKEAGIWFERSVGLDKPVRTKLAKAPRVAILAGGTGNSDTTQSLRAIFGSDTAVVTSASLQSATSDPLAPYDVIYNVGQGYPSTANPTARARLSAFFARGGGYIGTGQSTTNFTFLPSAGLVSGSFTQASASAGGGITRWLNVGGADSPVTGGYPADDYLYMPSNVTYFSNVPAGAVVDGRNHPQMFTTSSTAASPGFVAGLWRSRTATLNNAPVIVHGNTSAGSRYTGLSTNPFSRQDAEREWLLMGQSALWSALTDEADSAIAFPAAATTYSASSYEAGCGTAAADICGTASATPGPGVAKVAVALQRAADGLWWDGSAFASETSVYADAAGTGEWTYAFPTSQFPADGDYVVRSRTVDNGGNVQVEPTSIRFTLDRTGPAITIVRPADGASYILKATETAEYGCSDAIAGVDTCVGTVADGASFDTSSIGTKSFTVNASDAVGNTSSATVSYSVIWDFSGFVDPIRSTGLNAVQAAAAVPVKFRLAGHQGFAILATGSPTSQQINCTTGALIGSAQPTKTAGNSPLQYDPATDEYTYVWLTTKSWQNTCRQLRVALADGTAYTANFRFTQ